MASTGVAVAGSALVVASAWTSGRGKPWLEAVASGNVGYAVKSGLPFLAEFALVAILAMAADTSLRPVVIALIVGLWMLWGITAYGHMHN